MAGLEVEPKRLDWQPIFSLSAKDFFAYMLHDKFYDPRNENAIFKGIKPNQMMEAADLLFRSRLDASEEFNPADFENDPWYQAATCQLIKWRDLTIKEEAIEFGIYTPSTPEEAAQSPTLEELFAYMKDSRFPNPLEFALIQARREVFLQAYIAEMGLYLAYEAIGALDEYESNFMGKAFPTCESIGILIEQNKEALSDPILVEGVRANLFDTPEKTTAHAQDALSLALYIKGLFPQSEIDLNTIENNLITSLICLHNLFHDAAQAEQLQIALGRIGIPLDPERRMLEEPSIKNLTEIDEYIGKYFSAMNSTHNR